ncbi:MAG: VanZ family protein [Planctomycetota bacterium]
MVQVHKDYPFRSPSQSRASSGGIAGAVLLALVVIAAVLYGSFLPFKRVSYSWSLENAFGLMDVSWRSTTWDDWITNVLVYLPVGFCVAYVVLRRKRASIPIVEIVRMGEDPGYQTIQGGGNNRCFSVVVAFGGCVSVMAETIQLGLAGRVASWTDVVFNVLGTAIGFLLMRMSSRWGSSVLGNLQRMIVQKPCTLICWLLTIALLVAHSDSFRFVTEDESFHRNLSRSTASFLSGPSAYAYSPSTGEFFGQVMAAFWFSVLGYFSALSHRESDMRPSKAWGFSVFHAMTVAGLSWLLHLLSRAGVLPWSMLVVWGLANLFGSWTAIHVVDKMTRSTWRGRRRLVAPTVFLVVAAGFQIGAIVAPILAEADLTFSANWMVGVQLPFGRLWHLPIHEAVGQVTAQISTLAIMVIACSILARRMGLPASWGIAGALVTLSVAASQVFLYSRTGGSDVTPMILAVVATLLAKQAYVALQGQPQIVALPRG